MNQSVTKLIEALKGKFNKELFPPVPSPKASEQSLFSSVTPIKAGYEVLNRTRGEVGDSALLVKELDIFLPLLIAQLDDRYGFNSATDSTAAQEALENFVDDFGNLITVFNQHIANDDIHCPCPGTGTPTETEPFDPTQVIDDGAIVTVKTWSSVKINEELQNIPNNGGGVAITNFEAGENLALGDVCGLNASGQMVKAISSDEETCKRIIGMANETISSGATGAFLINGFTTVTPVNVGDVLYVTNSAGILANTPPTASGSTVRVVGYATANNTMYFSPDRTWFTIV